MSIAKSIEVSESSGITFLDIDNSLATARISLFGGHILSFIPKSDNKERLWLSPHAVLNGDKPIRGGIPVCWPWFSDDHGREKGALPSHGFLRSQVWQLKASEDNAAGTTIYLAPSFTRADGFEYDCQVTLKVTVGQSLQVELITQNTGLVAFSFNTALHTYFQVDDINHVELTGISGDYKDKTDNWAVKQTPAHYTVTGETDRIHMTAAAQVAINERSVAVTRVDSQGHDSLVVWNPWQGAASIADMDAFGYKHMLCVETACTGDIQVAPGGQHILTQTVVPL
ncbi:D-hexose-6-phosphate mutarotase [Salinimonas sediminis]|uniref:Putative glucose-6-phosphate 1-epimerase n=1 Tax=Salinimonas sediminis TaxID=2303538 RepID=A0A346NMS1_9ALTE|nr:D-hexose-6-phosphate mutarotase [Salinimonas sediminis]AXR06828.1 D-hexose-6-phosphate mutarotase [Salinimonas sediminis]